MKRVISLKTNLHKVLYVGLSVFAPSVITFELYRYFTKGIEENLFTIIGKLAYTSFTTAIIGLIAIKASVKYLNNNKD